MAIVGAVLGVVGLAASYYFFELAKEERDLRFFIDPDRTEIISASRVNIAPIKVLRKDGSPIDGDVYAAQFYLWNAGKRPIKQGDVLTPLVVSLSPGDSTILDYNVVRASRPIVEPHLMGSASVPLHSFGVEFRIFEQNDGFVGQIIYQGPKDALLSITGLVEGVSTIRTKGSAGLWNFIKQEYLLLLVVIPWLPIFWKEYRAFRSGGLSVVNFVSLFVIPVLITLMFFLKYSEVRTKLDSEIPQSLRPPPAPPPANLKIG